MDEPVPFGSPEYVGLLLLMLFSRGMDFLSTWVATPNLVLEGNPVARWLGWKAGTVVNVMLCVTFSFWPLAAITISTTSLLVAARNFQSAWLMRTLGEERYRDWFIDRVVETPLSFYLFCLFAQTILFGGIGGALMYFSGFGDRILLVPFGIGLGTIAYAITVLYYTLLSVWRIRRFH